MSAHPATPATHATIQPLCTHTRAPAYSVHTFGVSQSSQASQRVDPPTFGHPRLGAISTLELIAAHEWLADHNGDRDASTTHAASTGTSLTPLAIRTVRTLPSPSVAPSRPPPTGTPHRNERVPPGQLSL